VLIIVGTLMLALTRNNRRRTPIEQSDQSGEFVPTSRDLLINGFTCCSTSGWCTGKQKALDVYFRQCSILVTSRDLAVMGATLANMGRNPITGDAVYDIVTVRSMMAIMFTCGMYDYSGEWAYRAGLPAKSGVSGGVLSVVNRQLGIATYSPRLDSRGNSHRGIEACTELAATFGLHAFDCLNTASSTPFSESRPLICWAQRSVTKPPAPPPAREERPQPAPSPPP
jgi:hypothetical protein